MQKKKGWVFLLLCSLLAGSLSLSASEDLPYIKLKPSVANEILNSAYKYVGSLDRFSIDVFTINDDIEEDMIVEVKHSTKVLVDRPDKLYIATRGDGKNKNLYLNKGIFTMYDVDQHYYAQLKTPGTIDGTLDYLFEYYDIKTPLANILYSDIAKRLKPTTQGHYFGLTRIQNVLCYYIGFSNKNSELQMWVEARGEPRIIKFTIIDKTGKREMRSTSWLRWNRKIPRKDYSLFHAPRNAMKINIEVPEGRK
ncbi:hypothetical protein MNB_SV-5-406 [hydrothermal vent metagenome]|uniref:Periplasmic protein n=1 Tax=hydrothermal vent metagenome TaxID=652676 RepID=A0A1W1EF19_9ZZZZ